MKAQQTVILDAWAETVQPTLRDRLTKSELTRQLDELFTAIRNALEAGVTGSRDPQAADLLSVLNDLSRNRARHGFSATETAVSVFAVKEAIRRAAGDKPQALSDHAEFSTFVDELGLY